MTQAVAEQERGETAPASAPVTIVPSGLDQSQPRTARLIGACGLIFLAFGLLMQLVNAYSETPRFTARLPILGVPMVTVWLILGLAGVMWHALRDSDRAMRRVYGLAGYAVFVFGAVLLTLAVATAWIGSGVWAIVATSVLGAFIVMGTAAPFVAQAVPATRTNDQGVSEADGSSTTAGSATTIRAILTFLPRWLHGLMSNSLVQQATVVSLVAVVAFIVGSSALTPLNLIPYALGGLTLGAAFLLIFSRHETETTWRDAASNVVGLVGVLAALVGLNTVWTDAAGLVPSLLYTVEGGTVLANGLTLGVVGLLGLWGFILLRGSDSDLGYAAAWFMIVVGVAAVVAAVTRSLLQEYMIPNGYLLIMLGLVYAGVGVGFAIDHPLVVLTRRELTVMFYSPIAYFVTGSLIAVAWLSFYLFVDTLGPSKLGDAITVQEPIVRYYFFDLFPVMFLTLAVPAITMRLLSEEKQSGTIEVLLTAPVNETAVVLSKFFGAFIFFMLTWAIWVYFPMVLYLVAGEEFDYRPVLSFYLGMTFISGFFISMGLFFSSLTKDQIVALLLCFAAMIALTIPFFVLYGADQRTGMSPFWREVFQYGSYLYQMRELVQGKLHLKYIVSNLGLTAVFLFGTTLVLTARRWR